MKKVAIYAVLFVIIAIPLAVIGSALLAWLWQWIVPDVFNGAVEHGILPATITLLQAFKLSLLLWAFGLSKAASSSK